MGYWQRTFDRMFKRDPNAVGSNGLTRLQNAIYQNDLSRVRSLLKLGADPNYYKSSKNSHSPLAIAVYKRRIRAVSVLLSAKALPNQHFAGYSLLSFAVQKGHIGIIRSLLENGAKPNFQDEWTKQTPAFHVQDDDRYLVGHLLKYGLNIDHVDRHGQTALYTAIHDKRFNVALELLKKSANPNITPQNKPEAISLALENIQDMTDPCWEVAYNLVRAGANSNCVNDEKQSLFHLAVLFEDLDKMNYYKGVSRSVHAIDRDGNTPLHTALVSTNKDVISCVINTYNHLPKQVNRSGECIMKVLSNMSYYKYPDEDALAIISMMLGAGADPNVKNDDGYTLLHYAVKAQNIPFIKALLKHGADPKINMPNQNSVLKLAIDHQNLDMVDILLDYGANPNHKTENGWTLLDNLAKQGDRSSPIVQRLISGGGQYHKQLPANEHLYTPQPKKIRVDPLPIKKQPNKKPPPPKV